MASRISRAPVNRELQYPPNNISEARELKTCSQIYKDFKEEQTRLEQMGTFDLQAKIEEENWYENYLREKESGSLLENQVENDEIQIENQEPLENEETKVKEGELKERMKELA